MDESTKRIVIVEDDLSLVNLYLTQLKLSGYEVYHVGNGDLAVETIREEEPHLVLLDIVLPGKNGLQVLQDIRDDEELKDTKVVMLTNFGNEENVSTALELGALDYIMKYKIVPTELVDKVASLLGDSSGTGVALTE